MSDAEDKYKKMNDFISKWEPHLPTMQAFDVFCKNYLEDVLQNMEQANQQIRNTIAEALKNKFDSSGSEISISNLFTESIEQKSPETLDAIAATFKENNLDPRLLTMLGCVQQNMLVAERLHNFITIFEQFKSLHLSEQNHKVDQIRNLMEQLGPNLKFIWQRLLELCTNVAEKDILRKIFEADSTSTSKKN